MKVSSSFFVSAYIVVLMICVWKMYIIEWKEIFAAYWILHAGNKYFRWKLGSVEINKV
jgi:hypothetical protein